MRTPNIRRRSAKRHSFFCQLLLLASIFNFHLLPLSHALSSLITPGVTKIPQNVNLLWGFNPVTHVNVADYIKDQRVVIVGLPAAFVETSSNIQVPSYLNNIQALKDCGVQNVLIYTCNDSAVVGVWNKKLLEQFDGGKNDLVTFLADPSQAFTNALGMELNDHDNDDVKECGLLNRCKRFAMIVEPDGTIFHVATSESPDDPMGELIPQATCAEAILEVLRGMEPTDL